MRLAKQIKKKIANTTDEAELAKLRSELHIAEVDEAYAINHPHAEPYISIYGKSTKKEGDDDEDKDKVVATTVVDRTALLEAERPPLWTAVEEAMTQGPDALRRLRERRPENGLAGARGGQDKKARVAAAGHGPSKANKPEKTAPAKAKAETKAQTQAPAHGKASGAKAANGAAGKTAPAQMNRRERRRLMHEAAKAKEDEDDGEGFFE